MNWMILVGIYVGFMVVFSLVTKLVLNRKEIDSVVHAGLMNLLVGVMAIFISVVSGYSLQINQTTVLGLASAVIVYSFAVSLYYIGLKKVDLSKAVVLSSTSVFWVFGLSLILLNEAFSWLKLIGMLLVVLALRLIVGKLRHFKISKHEGVLLFSTLFYAAGALLDKTMTAYVHPFFYIGVTFFCVGMTIILVFHKRIKQSLPRMWKSKNYKFALILVSMLVMVAFWSLLKAYSTGVDVSRVYILSQSSAVLTAVSGVVVLNERTGWQNKLMALGLVLIAGWLLR